MMDAPRKMRVVIAGGGTAGWCSAAALSQQLGKVLDITLVESDAISTVGVGEATIPTARTFTSVIGANEADLLKASLGTIKLAIVFENWAREGDRYIHSFGQVGKSTWLGDFQHFWLEAQSRGIGGPIIDYCAEALAADQHRFGISEQAELSYAYHFDAARYAQYLRKLSEANGAKRVEGTIATVDLGEDGDIASLTLSDGRRIEGDLFIDCTGFRALLIGQALGVGYEDWSHWLPMNRALVAATKAVREPVPYTRAVAHDAGWIWHIPLQNRMSNGLLFSSDYLSEADAHARLREMTEGEYIADPRLIQFQTGRRKVSWERNCVALGLSSGFIEPLESTSIHLMMIGVTRLLKLFPAGKPTQGMRDWYNAGSRRELESVRDFIIMHYHVNQRREGALWERMRNLDLPDTLVERLAIWREAAQAYQTNEDLFRIDSWLQVLFGQRLQPDSWHPMARMLTDEQLTKALGDLKRHIDGMVAQLPTHQQFIDRYCATPATPGTVAA